MPGTPALLFDLDGVLIDSRATVTACHNEAFAAHGLPTRPPQELEYAIGPPLSQVYSELTDHPADSPEVAALIATYRERYAIVSVTDTPAAPGIPAILVQLARTYRLAVATSKPRPYAVPILRSLDLERYFEVICGPASDIAGESKAVTVGQALAALGVGAEAIMIGDRSHDVIGARTHRLPTIGVTWGIGTREELVGANAAAVIDRADELPAAIARVAAEL